MTCRLCALGMVLLAAGTATAQHRGRSVADKNYGLLGDFGNIVYPGTGGPPPIHYPGFSHHNNFATRLGRTITGTYPYGGGGHHRPGYGGAVAIPYAVPVYYGGYGYAPPPPVDYVQVMNNPVPQQQPTVIINQYFTPDAAKPVVREYKDGELSEPASPLRSYQAPIPSQPHVEAKPTVYLIAYKNQSIYPAVGYWLEGDTLHYITTQGAHNRASLDLIDQAFSEQLNRERNIDFKLTAP